MTTTQQLSRGVHFATLHLRSKYATLVRAVDDLWRVRARRPDHRASALGVDAARRPLPRRAPAPCLWRLPAGR